MQLTMKADIFKELVSRSIKGASQNKLIPVTGLMAIKVENNKATLITTDASNYLYINQDNVMGEDFYVVVQVEQFSKLIGKMTCETISLEVNDGILNVKGNGDYKIELPLDEEGNTIQFPDPVAKVKTSKGIEVALATIKTILASVKPALAVTMEVPVYTRYYAGERIVATDTYKVSSLDANVFGEDPLLISAETMNLLDVMTCEKIKFIRSGDVLLFDSPDCVVFGHSMEGVEDYQIDAISDLLKEEFDSKCKLDKAAFLAILDRIALFVGQYDNKAIVLTFTEDGVDISSKTSNGVETLKYLENENFKPYTCHIDIDMLITQLKANTGDSIQLHYGKDSSIKLVDGNITQVIALLEEQ